MIPQRQAAHRPACETQFRLLPTKDAAKFIEALPAKQLRQIWLKVQGVLRAPCRPIQPNW